MHKLIGPAHDHLHPIPGFNDVIFLKNFITAPNFHIGDYTYFDDRDHHPTNFEKCNILYNYDFNKVKLIIGKFCAIADRIRFLMTDDHKLDALALIHFPRLARYKDRIYTKYKNALSWWLNSKCESPV